MNKNLIPYKQGLKKNSVKLRNKSTLSEVLLWRCINKKQLGFTFNRQKPLLKYIVDFYCKDLSLVIEIDGESHNLKEDYDELRQKELEDYGLTFLRFSDLDVKKNLEGVVEEIKRWIKGNIPRISTM